MPEHQLPEAPPSYAQATGSSTASSRLQVPQAHNGIPTEMRRSMEDEQRPLPAGWVRQWDKTEQHQFFVDTNADPPRSIWQHPHDDEDYLKTLTSEERERIQEEEHNYRLHLDSANVSDNEAGDSPAHKTKTESKTGATQSTSTQHHQSQQSSSATGGQQKSSFGRRLKDKVTGMTHEERQADRARREEEERQYYEAHMRFRQAMQRAQMTGEPQFLARDKDGRDVYVEPPQMRGGYGGGMYGNRGYGYNPYTSGPYASSNARFIRPQAPYGRPYGTGYGGGMGFPLAGGLMGGMLLGGLLF